MNRREFSAGLGSAAAWPVVARAQQSAVPVIGFFSAGSAATKPWPQLTAAFRQGLQEIGFVERRNVAIEYRWAENQYDRLPALAAELVERHVAVIVATARAHFAAKAATATIPIVFANRGDPVRDGQVASLNRPGGNLTGVSVFAADLNEKRFGLFHDLVPQAAVIGVISDLTNSNREIALQQVHAAARSLGVPIRVAFAGTEAEIEAAFTSFADAGVGAVFLNNSFFFYGLSQRLAALAARYRIALSGENRVFVEHGGLMSYGVDEVVALRQAGRYAGRILKGEKPADLPVLLPSKFEFAINLKTAKALGLTIPPTLLAIADEVIE
jgi:putative tryptophan/tyrosine transport system substrate-binding protein